MTLFFWDNLVFRDSSPSSLACLSGTCLTFPLLFELLLLCYFFKRISFVTSATRSQHNYSLNWKLNMCALNTNCYNIITASNSNSMVKYCLSYSLCEVRKAPLSPILLIWIRFVCEKSAQEWSGRGLTQLTTEMNLNQYVRNSQRNDNCY